MNTISVQTFPPWASPMTNAIATIGRLPCGVLCFTQNHRPGPAGLRMRSAAELPFEALLAVVSCYTSTRKDIARWDIARWDDSSPSA